MKCRLCLNEYEKLCEAHIIPEFMYKGLYDDKNFFYKIVFSGDENVIGKLPQGKYDKEILCSECDNYINKIGENFVSKIYEVLLDGTQPTTGVKVNQIPKRKMINQVPGHLAEYHFCNLDYKKFKMFYLSLLWKSSISHLDEFKEVNLGKHEEVLRNMIKMENPGEIKDYPVLIFNFREDVSILEEVINLPKKHKDSKGTIYLFHINGLMYRFYISKHRLPEYVINKTINKENKLEIPIVPRGQGEVAYRLIFDLYKQ